MRLFKGDNDDHGRDAAGWSIRVLSGVLNPTEWDEFVAWLDEDPKNSEEFERALKVWQRLDDISSAPETLELRTEALNALRRAQPFPWSRSDQRTWQVGLAFVASVIMVAISASYLVASPVRALDGDRSAVRQYDLADGSSVALGPNARIALDFSKDARSVALLAGEAYFQVAKTDRRPFTITALGHDARVEASDVAVRLASDMVTFEPRNGQLVLLSPDQRSDAILTMKTIAAGQKFALARADGSLGSQSDLHLAWGDGEPLQALATPIALAGRQTLRGSSTGFVR